MPSSPDPEITGLPRPQPTPSFEEVFRATYTELRDFVTTYVHSQDIAHELVQDLFLRIWEMRDGPNPPPLTRAYLFSAARNRALRYLRHRRVEQRWEENLTRARAGEPIRPGTDSETEYLDLAAAARRAIDELPERCRQVFILSRQQHLRYQEIAQVLGISVSTVETQIWRALKTLRTKLAPFLVVVFSVVC